MAKAGIIGSRTFNNYEYMKEKLKEILNITEIVSGGAKGADKLAERYANENNIPIKLHLPDWNTYGKSAGFRRNQFIVDDSDILVAFWDGVSKGTKDTIFKGKLKSKPVFIYSDWR